MVFVPTTHTKEKMSAVPRKSYARLPQVLDIPNLIKVQLESFRWFQEEGLKQLLAEVSPIKDFTGNRLELSFIGYEFRQPHHSEQECRQRDLTYSSPLYVRTRLLVKETGEIKEQQVFLGDFHDIHAQDDSSPAVSEFSRYPSYQSCYGSGHDGSDADAGTDQGEAGGKTWNPAFP